LTRFQNVLLDGLRYRWTRRLSPGLEFYGGTGLVDQADPVSHQQHYIFPTISGELVLGERGHRAARRGANRAVAR
jgi:hypothetical protein